VQAPAADELDGNDDEDQMDDMIVNIGMEYDLGSGDQQCLYVRWKKYSLPDG
jgi:hypothetical protein